MTVIPTVANKFQGLYSDTKPVNVPVNSIFEELDTGDNLIYDGTYWWVKEIGPFSQRKIGYWTWGNNVVGGTGHFNNLTAATNPGTQTQAIDTTNGRYQNCISGIVAGNKGGYRNATTFLFNRSFNPKLRFKLKLVQATNARYYFGFLGGGSIPELTGDSPLDNLSGFLLGVMPTTSTTNWTLCYNNGAATSTLVNTGIAFDTTTINDIRLAADEANTRFSWSLNGNAYTHVVSPAVIPASTTALSLVMSCETSSTTAANFQLFTAFAQQDK